MKIYEKKTLKLNDKLYFIKNPNMKKKDFLVLFYVKKNTYFYKLYGRLYDFLIGGSINLHKEYKKYYKKEYFNFKEYLIEHHNIPENMIENFYNKNSFYKYKDIGNEQPLYSLLQDSKVKQIAIEFMGGTIYED